MKYCMSCGTQTPDPAAFCPACGTRVETVAAETAPVETAVVEAAVVEAPPAKPRRNVKDLVFSIVAMASGIEGAVLSGILSVAAFFPLAGIIYNFLAPLLGIVGLIFAGLVREPQNAARAKAGRITSLVSIIVAAVSFPVAIVWTVFFMENFAH